MDCRLLYNFDYIVYTFFKILMPEKLVRTGQPTKRGETRIETRLPRLNELFILKVKEELAEIERSGFSDVDEFGDLLQVVLDFANANGINRDTLEYARLKKTNEKGNFTWNVLTVLNPENPSNAIYFANENQKT